MIEPLLDDGLDSAGVDDPVESDGGRIAGNAGRPGSAGGIQRGSVGSAAGEVGWDWAPQREFGPKLAAKKAAKNRIARLREKRNIS